ncbi:DNA polymerase III subunit chi [Piscinibacter sakaiensis]|uniref:DNA polymerase III, chi subunit n=1 Tax=Piscinibacter sakaiensis TaxID=1547922 RepID=A0A0K8NXC6_PISS1|nr:DNA polymerase III subunit chi [Piscinibacter sakaiensis]GAP34580.1 DNA polymerase III, chi subunit [Piscinibacter sakaiensis]
MTEVQFHFNAPDRLVYACRLLRKALRRDTGVAVTGDTQTLDQLDRALWTFGEETDFLPHLRLRADAAAPPPRLRRTPLWLVDAPQQADHLPVLLNLGAAPPAGFEAFERLVEIVGQAAPEREAARARWRHYASRGYPVAGHEVGAA